MSTSKTILFLTSILSYILSPIVVIYKSFKNYNTGEVLLSNKVIEQIEHSSNPDQILKKLYDLK